MGACVLCAHTAATVVGICDVGAVVLAYASCLCVYIVQPQWQCFVKGQGQRCEHANACMHTPAYVCAHAASVAAALFGSMGAEECVHLLTNACVSLALFAPGAQMLGGAWQSVSRAWLSHICVRHGT